MCFHWLRCRNAQGQFCYYWRPGTQNLADYFTKHHPTSHHKSVHPTILTTAKNPEYMKLFDTTTTPVTLEQQTKTLVSTKSFVRNLLQTPRFKTMSINTVTAKSAYTFLCKGVIDLQVSTYLSDGTNCQISSDSCQS
jgi:hypothetical protein